MRLAAAPMLAAALLAAMPPALQAQDIDPAAAAVKPMPAEHMPRAAQGLVLDVTRTGKHLVAVGERGHILVSNDGGQWAQVDVPVRATLTAVSFADANNGWVVGHDATILNTIDGGRTWFLQNFEPGKGSAFLDVLFVDARRGYAVGAFGMFYSTQDGGENWSEVTAPEVRDEELVFHCITRLGNGALLVAGETGMLGMSSDGRKWQRLKSPYEGTLFGALAYGPRGAIVFGHRGAVFVSADVGAGKWKKIETGSSESFFAAQALPGGRVLLVGTGGVMLRIDPAIGRVEPLASGTHDALTSVAAIKGGVELVAGEAGFRRVAP